MQNLESPGTRSTPSSLVTQPVGDGLLVADPRSGDCHHLDAPARLVLEGREAELTQRYGPELGGDLARVARTRLHEVGLSGATPEPMTRQEFLRRWGVAVAAPVILTLALPRPAQAASAPAPPPLLSLNPSSGWDIGGTMVIITGSGFTGATAVAFGPKPADSFTVDSDTQITATAPWGDGIVQVTVTTPNGTSNPLPYEYIPT